MAADPREFGTLEKARTRVRVYRGASGSDRRERAIKRGTYRAPKLELPVPYVDEWKRVEVSCKLAAVLCDIHIPYHDHLALAIAVADAKKRNPDVILINGDMLDYYQISKFPKAKKRPTIVEEIRLGAQFLAYLRQEFPKARIVYKYGNHDERYEQYILDHVPEIIELVDDSMMRNLKCDESGIEVYSEQEIIDVNGLPVLHGHELPKGMTSPVSAARGAFLRTLESCIIGHHHQTSSQPGRQAFSGRIISTHSVGCLCQLSPKYARVNQWNHGFAYIHRKGTGYEVENKKIIEGVVY
jgi:predicted phosphodiesterase